MAVNTTRVKGAGPKGGNDPSWLEEENLTLKLRQKSEAGELQEARDGDLPR